MENQGRRRNVPCKKTYRKEEYLYGSAGENPERVEMRSAGAIKTISNKIRE